LTVIYLHRSDFYPSYCKIWNVT